MQQLLVVLIFDMIHIIRSIFITLVIIPPIANNRQNTIRRMLKHAKKSGSTCRQGQRMKRATLRIAILAALSAACQASVDMPEDMSLEDLVKADITSVARKRQSLADVPAAAFVIT